MVLIIRILLVAVHRKSPDILAVLTLHLLLALHLHGNIPAVCVIDKVLHRQHKRFLIEIRRQRIIIVAYRYETHLMLRECLLYQPSGTDIIPSEPRQILYYNAVNQTCLDVSHHPLKSRSVKIRTGPSVVNIEIIYLHVVLFPYKTADDIPLRCYAVALCLPGFPVILGKPEVHSNVVKIFYLHCFQPPNLILARYPSYGIRPHQV